MAPEPRRTSSSLPVVIEDIEDHSSTTSKNNDMERQGEASTTALKIIEWLQKHRLSKKGDETTQGVQLISGLDAVWNGTVAAADAVRIAGIQPPRYLCYMLSGMSCDILQFLFDLFLHYGLGFDDPSLCWAVGFVVSIVPRHTSLRYMCFGDYVGGYWSSLRRMYFGFSFSIVLSTVFNVVMTRMAGVSHYVAWIFTLIWTGIVNYFILKKLWSFGGADKDVTQ